MKEHQYEVIVVGASNAGGMAAAAAAEKGAKVLVIDKMNSAGYLYRETIASLHSKAQKKLALMLIVMNSLILFRLLIREMLISVCLTRGLIIVPKWLIGLMKKYCVRMAPIFKQHQMLIMKVNATVLFPQLMK